MASFWQRLRPNKDTAEDAEIREFRTLLPPPKEFKTGFGWVTIAGLIFCGLVMIPGSIYLGLITGGSMANAASWVTVILFMEISRRSMKPLNKQELVILLHAAHVMMAGSALFPGGPLSHLVFRGYLVGSDAVRDAGLLGRFPSWFSPAADSEAILARNLLHPEWTVPILLMLFIMIIGMVQRYTLGYFFFRLTSDVEGLPFPLAPISAQGAMALAEAEEQTESRKSTPAEVEEQVKKDPDEPPSPLEAATEEEPDDQDPTKKKGMRWRIFSLGAYIGIGFGFLQIGIPAITSLFLARPFFLIPQPFWDTTTITEGALPATPTGIAIDLGLFVIGFILPFWAVMGSALAVIATTVLNPILHSEGVLTTWQPGMDTVNTLFSNRLDFWLSFEIGAALGIAAVSLYATFRGLRKKKREMMARHAHDRVQDPWTLPRKNRGDYPLRFAILLYVIASAIMIAVALILIPFSYTIAFFLIFFGFIYNPLISYINARLLGIAGQTVDIPYTKEMAFMFSGAEGIEIWLAPIPIENYGHQTQAFRVNELTGVTFWSLIKTDAVAFPLLFFLSLGFWAFIWASDPVPGPLFPAAEIRWDLAAKQQVLVMGSTLEDTEWKNTDLGRAIKPGIIAGGFGVVVGLFSVMTFLGLPVMLVYGFVRGFGDFPHMMIPEVLGAIVARWYFKRKYGSKYFLRIAPTFLAGYMTGVGLIGMLTIATRLIQNAVSGSPF
ncbi:MAG: peptide transporter [Puniceicoccaceae bacterium]|nr:MAG: peptide transporter [Puniceicoccaceae bacterium]